MVANEAGAKKWNEVLRKINLVQCAIKPQFNFKIVHIVEPHFRGEGLPKSLNLCQDFFVERVNLRKI